MLMLETEHYPFLERRKKNEKIFKPSNDFCFNVKYFT